MLTPDSLKYTVVGTAGIRLSRMLVQCSQSIPSHLSSIQNIHEIYTYLGDKFNVASELEQQVDETVSDYSTSLDFISTSPLPLIMKLEAVRQICSGQSSALVLQCTYSSQFLL